MNSKKPADHPMASAQQAPNVSCRDLPTLERFLVKIGFFDDAFLRLYMITLIASPYLFEYLICRLFMEYGNETCRLYRSMASKYIDMILVLYFARLFYLGWARKRQLAAENQSVTSN